MHINARRHYQPLKEIQRVGQLARTWQRNLPDEQRPAFEQAQLKLIDNYLRKGDRARHRPMQQEPIEIHNGLMHEHNSRSARMIERTLRNGLMPAHTLESFRDGSREQKIDEPYWRTRQPVAEQRAHLPKVDVFLQHSEDTHDVSHFDSGSGAFVPQQAEVERHVQLRPQ